MYNAFDLPKDFDELPFGTKIEILQYRERLRVLEQYYNAGFIDDDQLAYITEFERLQHDSKIN